ncbi:MAG TPA: histidine phosphatase family protein [Candidatus Dormibacteraeota bacterium]
MAPPCRVHLIRHGEAAMPDPEGRILNYSGARLTARGREQARRMAAVLDRVHVDAVVSSDLERAQETARIVAAGRAPVLTDPRLREIDLGGYDGMTFAEVAEVDTRFLPWPGVAFYGRLARAGYHVPSDLAFPGGESVETLHRRLLPGLVELAAARGGQTVAVVSHGYAIQALLCQVTACDLANYYRFMYANAVTTIVDVDESGTGELLVHNGNQELERATAGRLGVDEGPGTARSDDREATCRVVMLCPGDGGDGLAAGLRGVPMTAVRLAPGAASRDLGGAVEAATGVAPLVDPGLGDGDAAPGRLAALAAASRGGAVVVVAEPPAMSRLGAHVVALPPGGAARLPALAGGLGLAEVEADGRGVLHIWNGRIAPEHVRPG